MSKKLILTLACAGMVVNCSPGEKAQELAPQIIKPDLGSLVVEDVKISFSAGEEPHNYHLLVKVPFKVSRLELNFDHETVAIGEESDSVGLSVANYYRYDSLPTADLDIFDENNTLVRRVGLGSIQMPRDFVIENSELYRYGPHIRYQIKKREYRNYNRVFFAKGAKPNLYGSNLKIEADELIFQGDNRIYMGQGQRNEEVPSALIDGSDISLRAKKARGFLVIQMLGQPGKRGLPNSQFKDLDKYAYRDRARDGRQGRDAVITMDVSGNLVIPRCLQQPSHGEDGDDAGIYHAENGTQGGDSGNLTIDIEDYSEAKFKIFFAAGKGGEGGKIDYKGQKGGLGGPPGKSFFPCVKAKAGRNGRDSSVANFKAGIDGKDGELGNLSVPNDTAHFKVLDKWDYDNPYGLDF